MSGLDLLRTLSITGGDGANLGSILLSACRPAEGREVWRAGIQPSLTAQLWTHLSSHTCPDRMEVEEVTEVVEVVGGEEVEEVEMVVWRLTGGRPDWRTAVSLH